MAKYSDNELNNDWEFKIMRSLTGAFKNPHTLQNVIENQQQYGWQFLEKFDDNRIRFKRKSRHGSMDHSENPYETYYGMKPGKFSAIVILLSLLGSGILVAIIVLMTEVLV